MNVAAALATTLAVVLAHLSSRHQRWLSAPLPGFPARSSAVLASFVGLAAWLDAQPVASAVFAWLMTSVLVAIAISASAALRESDGQHRIRRLAQGDRRALFDESVVFDALSLARGSRAIAHASSIPITPATFAYRASSQPPASKAARNRPSVEGCMKSAHSARCLTRVMVDDDGVEIAQLQSVMQRIQRSLFGIPTEQREFVANALLNLAVSRMVKEEGSARTMSILMRLGDVVSSADPVPPPQRAVDLVRRDA